MDIHGAVFSFFGMHNAQPKPTFRSTYYDAPILTKFYVIGLRGKPLDEATLARLDDPSTLAEAKEAHALGAKVAKRVSRRLAKRWGARIDREERRWERRSRDADLHACITGFFTPGYTSFVESPVVLLANYYTAYFTRKDAMYEPIRAMNPPGWARIPMHLATVSVNRLSQGTPLRPGDSVVSRDTRPVMTPASHDSEHVAPAIWGPHGYYDVRQALFRQPAPFRSAASRTLSLFWDEPTPMCYALLPGSDEFIQFKEGSNPMIAIILDYLRQVTEIDKIVTDAGVPDGGRSLEDRIRDALARGEAKRESP